MYTRGIWKLYFFPLRFFRCCPPLCFPSLRRTLDAKIVRPRFNAIALCTCPSGRVQLADDRRVAAASGYAYNSRVYKPCVLQRRARSSGPRKVWRARMMRFWPLMETIDEGKKTFGRYITFFCITRACNEKTEPTRMYIILPVDKY